MMKIKNAVGAILFVSTFIFANILVNTNSPITVQATSNPVEAPVDWAFGSGSVELHDAILLLYPEFDLDGDGFISVDEAQAATGEIILREKNIAGTLNGIENFINISTIDLYGNKLTGEIPAEIGNMLSIEKLSLSNNGLSGVIPTEIGNLTTVIDLRLAKNKFTGSIPTNIGNLKKLELLDLNTNQLTGAIPAEIGNLNSLTNLDLSSNKLTGELPDELRNLAKISTFLVSWNQLSGPIPDWISEWSNAVTIGMSGNRFNGEVPASIGTMPRLFQLLLDNNELTSVSSGIAQSKTLWNMPLYNNKLTSLPKEVYDYIVARNASTPTLVRFSNQTSALNLTSVGPLETDYSFAAYPAYNQFVDYGMTFSYILTQPDGIEINVMPTLQDGQLIIDGADLTQSGVYTLVANGTGGRLDPVLYTTYFEIGSFVTGPDENSSENNSNGNGGGNTELPQTGQTVYEYLLVGSVLVAAALVTAIIASKRKVE
ncbi:hypothetical protein [Culicoidibacter larvae]|uniref:LPXTG cell wall anchor domain-containing protein n=1 Tax=Culicoidibacter larvae TaxID=2579976 RepID=A0A5R8QGH3_9FIRM|nr:hypothetical protein [Culicoidibacter larvae]TLG76553.1 hypothetical protein FEZ08_02750 [Culicoidibacter larvae]